jgi:nucleotide-binding universal stress UspA family protein
MHRFSNILLVPLGQITEIPPGLEDAMDLVAEDDASRTFIAVAPPARRLQHQLSLGDATAITDTLVESLTEALGRLARQLRTPTSVSVVVGRPPVEVVRAVARVAHDLVVILSDDSDDSAATTGRILRTCPCPVWVVRDRVEGGRVLRPGREAPPST